MNDIDRLLDVLKLFNRDLISMHMRYSGVFCVITDDDRNSAQPARMSVTTGELRLMVF